MTTAKKKTTRRRAAVEHAKKILGKGAPEGVTLPTTPAKAMLKDQPREYDLKAAKFGRGIAAGDFLAIYPGERKTVLATKNPNTAIAVATTAAEPGETVKAISVLDWLAG